jgi:HAD superfamily hydrolase (TIGR01509 family)
MSGAPRTPEEVGMGDAPPTTQGTAPRPNVIFDLDGTLTRPYLDFQAIRDDIGLPPGPVLEGIAALDGEPRRRAETILERHESAAARNATLQDGAVETLAALRGRGYAVAILTRNARRWVEVVLQRFDIVVDAVRTRDDGVVKPAVETVHWLQERVHGDPRRSWMVGDHLFDIVCGRSAGARTVLMIGDAAAPPDYAVQADHVIRRLPQLLALLP